MIIDKIIAAYSGRFQPFHAGHYYAYLDMVKKFGKKNVFITTSNKTDSSKSPFNFKEKKAIITSMFKIPSDQIIQVKNPYNPVELKNKFDGETTALVVGLGEKDANRLSGGKYYKKYNGKFEMGFNKGGYVYTLPQLQLKIDGKIISGVHVRKIFATGSDKEKKELFIKLYGKMNNKIFKLINQKIIKEYYNDFIKETNFAKIIKEITISRTDGADVDDGPGTWYTKFNYYKKDVIKRATLHGWRIIDYVLGNAQDVNMKAGPSLQVSYFPAGVGKGNVTPMNYKNLSGQVATRAWLKDIRVTALKLGYKFINWANTINDLDQAENDSIATEKEAKKDSTVKKKLINLQKNESWFTKDWWKRQLIEQKLLTANSETFSDSQELLLCGGAYGHLSHPFDDNNLTFDDFRSIIEQTLSGEIINHGPVEEKCLHGDTIVLVDGKRQKIKDVVDKNLGEYIYSYNVDTNEFSNKPIMSRSNNGITENWLEIILEDGKKIQLTESHRVLTNNGYKKAIDLKNEDKVITWCS